MLFKDKIFGYDELSKLESDIFIIGHYHVDQGIEKVNDKYFVNLGSMSRGTQSDENIEHSPKIGYVRITVDEEGVSTSAQAIKLKVRPASEIFDIKKRKEEEKENKEIEVFVEKLMKESDSVSTDEGNKDEKIQDLVHKIDVEKEVREKVTYFLQEANSIISKGAMGAT